MELRETTGVRLEHLLSQRKRKFIHDDDGETRKRPRTDQCDMETQTSTQASTQSSRSTCQIGPVNWHVSNKVLHIFEYLYKDVANLHTWVTRMDIEGLNLVQEGDPQGYVNLLHSTLVADVEMQKVLPPTSLSQASHQREVILRVIQRLKKRNINNVLCWGFDYMSDNPSAHILGHTPGLEYRVPNSAFNRLQYNPWKRLLSRIGDELMTRLLERTSLFSSVPPSNYVQLAGVPIFEMWSSKATLPLPSKNGRRESWTDSKLKDDTQEMDKTLTTDRGVKRKLKDGEKTGKRKRREKNSMKSDEKEIKFKPFHFHKLLPRQSILYSKCLAENLPKAFCLCVVESPAMLSKLILEQSVSVDLPQQQQPQQEHKQQQQEKQVPSGTSHSQEVQQQPPKPHQRLEVQVTVIEHCQPPHQQQLQQEREVPTEENNVPQESTRSQTKLEGLCKKLIHNHRKCPYKSLLNHYCENKHCSLFRKQHHKSIPVYTRGKTGPCRIQMMMKRSGHKWLSVGQLLDSTVSSRQIFLFLRAVCLKVIPLEMFGDEKNRKVFFKHLQEILALGRHEKYCLGQLMMKIKVTSYKYLREEYAHLQCVRTVAQIHWWIFTSYIFPVIKSFFYVTETNVYRNRLVYYRKSVWLQLHTRGLTAHLQRKMLTPVAQSEVEDLLDSGQTLGVSQLRFLPKLKSLRPVVNMGRKPEAWTKKKLSINSQLKTVLSILQYHMHQNPALVGSGKFGFDDIFTAYRRFIVRRQDQKDERPLYFVKTDINKCYDNILQDKLYSVINDIVMTEDRYITRRYVSVMVSGDRLKRTFHRETFTLADYEPDFNRYVQKHSVTEGLTNSVLVDQVIHPHTTAEQVLRVLKSHLFNNIIKIGRRFYRQSVGIGQGSVLSTMLCSLYTAHMERLTMTPAGDDELTMRLVDDNLYITPYRDEAVNFLDGSLQGNKDYNLYSNMEKVLVNFKHHHPQLGSVPTIGNEDSFPWCGMLLDTQNLSVSVDYSRYAGQAIRDTLTLDFAAQPGVCLKNKLLLTLRSRCHSLYLDPQINSVTARVNNIYKACLLSAYKLHCYVLNVWPARRRNNHVFLKKVILILAQYLYYKQESILKEIHIKPEISIIPLSFPLIKWLCVEAHIVKLQQHHSMYSSLLTLLKRYRKGFWRRMSIQDRQEVRQRSKDDDFTITWSGGLRPR